MTKKFPSRAKAMSFIVTRDREKSKIFYGAGLGFRKTSEDGFAVVFDLNGTMLRISEVSNFQPQVHTVLGWEVPDIVDSIKELVTKGVRFTIYEGMGQDDLGIWRAPGGGAAVAWFLDPDGNNLSLTQF
jgi:catechol 2,3-dioxygenase-like lactoylglutathione lyase family enzyme